MLTHCGIAKLSKKMFEEQWAILEDNALKIAKVTCQSHYQGLRRRIDDFKERHDIKVCIQAAASNANTEMTQEVLTALQNLSTRLEDETGRIKHKIGQSKCYVKWKLSKLNKRREEDIKTKLENVTELSNFSIDSIEKGSVQIQSTVSFEIAHNPEMFAASVLQFLERLAIECKIDTSKDTAIDVEIVLSDVPWSTELNDRPLGMRYDEIRQIVYAYVSHSDKKWTHFTQELLQNVKLESTKQQQITMRSRKRKSKSKRVSVSERKRSKVLFSESEKGDDSLPSPSDSLYDEKGYTPWAMWSDEDVAQKLEDHVQQLSGEVLDMITEQRLTEYGLKIGGDRLRVLKLIRDWTTTQHNTKIFSDPIHGHIEVHPLCIKIIDTPQFQRLRDLKQIGGCYFVYPGASNNRFEHCIGVCYLAGKLARTLQKRQPELDITNKDILCVEIAGLCHDLGHGPFSHLFDEKFIPAVKQKLQWKHANGSVMMFNFLRTNNDLKKEFQKSGFEEKTLTSL
ncbi:SAMHD1 [Mytilus edulis]|uniref:SAMHD1 n=1 Tax=Mytilus edulis TaxID=6550 RepID=A0A8S3TTJ6_MYTED|nr:SAMHD1 [Mytilus edulis]